MPKLKNGDPITHLPSNIICNFLVDKKHAFPILQILLPNSDVHIRKIQSKKKKKAWLQGLWVVNLETICIHEVYLRERDQLWRKKTMEIKGKYVLYK